MFAINLFTIIFWHKLSFPVNDMCQSIQVLNILPKMKQIIYEKCFV